MPPRRPLAERFWEKVDVRGPDDCWEWTASRRATGYGQIQAGERKSAKAHRVAWELTHGPIPEGLFVLHSCDNPPCVNPAHLRLGTHAENMADRERRRRCEGPKKARVGEAHPMVKLTAGEVAEIRERHAGGGVWCTQLANEYGVSPSQVRRIIHRQSWRAAA